MKGDLPVAVLECQKKVPKNFLWNVELFDETETFKHVVTKGEKLRFVFFVQKRVKICGVEREREEIPERKGKETKEEKGGNGEDRSKGRDESKYQTSASGRVRVGNSKKESEKGESVIHSCARVPESERHPRKCTRASAWRSAGLCHFNSRTHTRDTTV